MNISQLPVIRFLVRYAKTYKIKSALIAVFLIVLIGMAAQTVLQQGGAESARERTPKVSLLNVNEYRIENALVESIGEVESLSQVELKAQVAERVKEIRVGIGERVERGEVLLVLDDASLLSQIDEAEAALDSAKVALQRARLEQDQQLRGDTLNKNYEDGLAVLSNLYNDFDALLEDLDDIFFGKDLSDGQGTNIQYYANANNNSGIAFAVQRLYNEAEALQQQSIVVYRGAERGSGDARFEAIEAGYNLAVKTAETIKTGRDEVRAFQDEILDETTVHEKQTLIDGQAAELESYAASMDGYVNSLLVIRNTINNQRDVLETLPISLQSAQLAVRQREASLQNLLTQQDKIAIPSPISGVVATIPARVGELVNPGETVVSVVNPGSLQIKTYINGKDIQFVTQGARARIEGIYEGSVTKVAPSLDPQTKKVETLVAVLDAGNDELVIGEFANVQIFISENLQNGNTFFLPLQSVKVTTEAAFVYTVSNEKIIEEHQVELGRVIGDSVEVLQGVNRDMQLVFSVRGLEPGDNVELE